MPLFSSQKVHSEEEVQGAIRDLRTALTTSGGQSVFELLKRGGEPGLISDTFDDHTLARWLRAEEYNVRKAETRLRDHAAWRAQYVPKGRILEEEVKRELDTGKAYVQGHDKLGRPLIVAVAKLHSRSVRDLEETKRFICYTLDAALRTSDVHHNPDGKLCSIFDLRGLKMDSIDSAVLRAVFDLLANHYPERLGKLWMLDSPGIFYALWKVVSPFVDSVTKAKIEFVDGHKAIEKLRAAIDPETLPKLLGGDADPMPCKQPADDSATNRASTS